MPPSIGQHQGTPMQSSERGHSLACKMYRLEKRPGAIIEWPLSSVIAGREDQEGLSPIPLVVGEHSCEPSEDQGLREALLFSKSLPIGRRPTA